MIDSGGFGAFYQSVANGEFSIEEFKAEIDKLPETLHIQNYLKELSNKPIDKDKMVYHYLLLQAGAFGSKQIWIKDGQWKNNTFRNYWLPTETSNRKSPVNPMMPMPNTLLERVENIVDELSGCINAVYGNVFHCLHKFDELENQNAVVYIDPPYKGTTGYHDSFDIYELYLQLWNGIPIYISEGDRLFDCDDAWLLSSGRSKGSISGEIKKKPTEEWLSYYIA